MRWCWCRACHRDTPHVLSCDAGLECFWCIEAAEQKRRPTLMRPCRATSCARNATLNGLCPDHVYTGVSPQRVEQIRAMHHDGTLLSYVQSLFDRHLGPLPVAPCYCGAAVNVDGIHQATGDVACYPDESDLLDVGAIPPAA